MAKNAEGGSCMVILEDTFVIVNPRRLRLCMNFIPLRKDVVEKKIGETSPALGLIQFSKYFTMFIVQASFEKYSYLQVSNMREDMMPDGVAMPANKFTTTFMGAPTLNGLQSF